MPTEVTEMRRWLHGQLDVPPGATIVDVGCGTGDDLRMLAAAAPQGGTLIGIDRSPEFVADARAATNDPRVTYVEANVAQGLPLEDASVDILYSVNLLECVPDKPAFLAECARVLRPGGQILTAHWDWDTQTFDGEDPALVRKILHAFSDWKQAWMDEADPWVGRRLHRLFAEVGRFEGAVKAYTMTCTSFHGDSYGWRQAVAFGGLVRRELISREEYTAFMAFLEDAAARGAFFYSVTMFAFVGHKKALTDSR